MLSHSVLLGGTRTPRQAAPQASSDDARTSTTGGPRYHRMMHVHLRLAALDIIRMTVRVRKHPQPQLAHCNFLSSQTSSSPQHVIRFSLRLDSLNILFILRLDSLEIRRDRTGYSNLVFTDLSSYLSIMDFTSGSLSCDDC